MDSLSQSMKTSKICTCEGKFRARQYSFHATIKSNHIAKKQTEIDNVEYYSFVLFSKVLAKSTYTQRYAYKLHKQLLLLQGFN